MRIARRKFPAGRLSQADVTVRIPGLSPPGRVPSKRTMDRGEGMERGGKRDARFGTRRVSD